MPSWVLPAVAAELWAVPVEQVMADVAAGRLPSRTERGLLFVDIDPAREAEQPETYPTPYRRSLAWAMSATGAQPVVTPEERHALLDEAEADDSNADDDLDPIPYDAPAPTALSDDDVPNWEAVRARVSRMRRAPGARDAA